MRAIIRDISGRFKKGNEGYWIGRKRKQKTKDKISDTKKGTIAWNKGKTKIDYPQLSNSGVKKGNIPWIKGKTKEDCPQLCNNGNFKKGHVPWNKNKKGCFTKETVKRMLRRRIPSSLEEKFQKIVIKHNLPYKFVGDGSFFIEQFNPDFINTNSEKIAIEVYMRFYKRLNFPDIEEWKKERAKVFTKYGWHIVYFDEIQVNEKYVLEVLGGK